MRRTLRAAVVSLLLALAQFVHAADAVPSSASTPAAQSGQASSTPGQSSEERAARENEKKKRAAKTRQRDAAAAGCDPGKPHDTALGLKAQSRAAPVDSSAARVEANPPPASSSRSTSTESSTAPSATAAQANPAGGPERATAPPPAPEPVKEDAAAGNAARAASERQEVETLRQTTLNLISLLVESGIITQEKAQALIDQAKRSAAQTTAPPAAPEQKVVRVPYVPQFMRDEMREQIKKEVVAQAKEERWAQPNALPEWWDRITLYGDFRLRYQGNYLQSTNAPAVDVQDTNAGNGLVLLNTTKSFDYLRYQLRLGLDARITDRIMVGTRLASGNTGNPVSLNQTLGNSFNKNSVVIDLAYIKGDPYDWLTLVGGRMPNPFFSTDLLWYDQLNFDGLAASARAPLPAGSKITFTGGAFPVETIDCTTAIAIGNCGNDKWLYAAQGVFESALRSSSTFKLGLAYYAWHNYQGQFNSPVVNPADRTFIPKFAQKGNTYFNIVTNGGPPLLGLAPRFKDINVTALYDFGNWDPVHVVLVGDFAKNIGYDQQEIFQRTGGLVNQPPRTNAWFARLSVGHPIIQKFGDWQMYAGYKWVERDSVVDGYNDPDFHFGGTDAKGYLVGMLFGLGKHAYLRLRWLSANSIDGPPLAWDVLQLDAIAQF